MSIATPTIISNDVPPKNNAQPAWTSINLTTTAGKTATIARNIEPLNELIEHGKTGLLWDGTEKHLGSLVDLLLGDNKLRNYLGKNLRSKVIKDFGNEKYFKSVKKILIRN